MLGLMAEKPTRTRRSRTYRLPDDLLNALEALAEDNRRPVTGELEIAIEKHLAENDRWPPPTKPSRKG